MIRRLIPLILAAILLSACGRTPDEEQVRENLDQVVTAVKARQPREVVEHLTQDFVAQEQMGVDEVRRFMLAQFFRNQQINLVVTGLKVTVEGQDAQANFRVVVTGGFSWIPERLDYYQVSTRWLKQDGDWLIRSAAWKPVLQTE